ncbi:hypothetical protein D3C85_1654870 [compost metagenome]
MPLGALDLLPGLLVGPLLAGGQAQIGDRIAIREIAHLGILSAGTDQNYFVYASCHDMHSIGPGSCPGRGKS